MEASAASAPAVLGRVSASGRLLRLRSDEQLVALFRAGNDEAFRVIHDRYRVRLAAYARRMLSGSDTDAEDVLQDVFLRAYRALRGDERPLSLRAWLYRVAHNRCIDHVRRPTPDAADVFGASRTPDLDPSVETEQREDLRQLVADLHGLPDQQRSALLMRELDGMSYGELADALETTVPAIKSLLVRARVGLVEAAVARNADCETIRRDLADAHERGVRASGRACRHTRDCSACSGYRVELADAPRGVAALAPAVGFPVGLTKLLGLGGAGTASAGVTAGGGSALLGGATAGLGKITAIVCCAAAVSGSAIEARHVAPTRRPAPATSVTVLARQPARSVDPALLVIPTRPMVADAPPGHEVAATEPAVADPSGGAIAPDTAAPTTAPTPIVLDPAEPPVLEPLPNPAIATTAAMPAAGPEAGVTAPADAATPEHDAVAPPVEAAPSPGAESAPPVAVTDAEAAPSPGGTPVEPAST